MHYLTHFFTVLLTVSSSFLYANYQRIVSLAPSLTQNIYEMKAESLLVGCTSYCNVDKSENKVVVADAIKVNLERIVQLKPDLIITTGLTPTKDIETLRKFKIRVEIFTTPRTFEEICSHFESLAQMLNKNDIAKSVITQVRTQVTLLRNKVKSNYSPKIFFQIGVSPLFTVIENTFMNDYITFSGGKNIAAGLSSGIISRESVVAATPEYIFIAIMGTLGNKEEKEWKKFRSIPAVVNNKIIPISADLACLPTPTHFAKTLELIIQQISPL